MIFLMIFSVKILIFFMKISVFSMKLEHLDDFLYNFLDES